MNQPTQIIVKDYMGTEAKDYAFSNKAASDSFYAKQPWFPCPAIVNTEPGKTILAELRWQIRVNKDLVQAGIDKEIRWKDANAYYAEELVNDMPDAFRQIWVPIVEQKEGEGKLPLTEFEKIKNRFEKGDYDLNDVMLRCFELGNKK